MPDAPYIAEVASLMGDPARANMLSALKNEGVLSATVLAHVAGVAPNTASGHPAGTLGVMLTWSLVELEYLHATGQGFSLEKSGESAFRDLGIDLDALRAGRRPLTRRCLDWSERRPHLGGALGGALLARLHALGWLQRNDGTRAVTLTKSGRQGPQEMFRIEPGSLRSNEF